MINRTPNPFLPSELFLEILLKVAENQDIQTLMTARLLNKQFSNLTHLVFQEKHKEMILYAFSHPKKTSAFFNFIKNNISEKQLLGYEEGELNEEKAWKAICHALITEDVSLLKPQKIADAYNLIANELDEIDYDDDSAERFQKSIQMTAYSDSASSLQPLLDDDTFANLSGADLSFKILDNLNLSFKNLSKAKFDYSMLKNAHITYANLDGAHFQNIGLEGADLSYSTLRGAKLASDYRQTNLSETNLTYTNFQGADLSRAIFNKARLIKTNLENAKLEFAEFSETVFEDVNFSKLDLNYAKFVNSDLQGLNFNGANLERAKLEGVNLSKANLEGANLVDADLKKANFQGANLRKIVISGDADEAIFDEADLTDANLFNANFTNASIIGANFTGANLYGASNEFVNHRSWELGIYWRHSKGTIPVTNKIFNNGMLLPIWFLFNYLLNKKDKTSSQKANAIKQLIDLINNNIDDLFENLVTQWKENFNSDHKKNNLAIISEHQDVFFQVVSGVTLGISSIAGIFSSGTKEIIKNSVKKTNTVEFIDELVEQSQKYLTPHLNTDTTAGVDDAASSSGFRPNSG